MIDNELGSSAFAGGSQSLRAGECLSPFLIFARQQAQEGFKYKNSAGLACMRIDRAYDISSV